MKKIKKQIAAGMTVVEIAKAELGDLLGKMIPLWGCNEVGYDVHANPVGKWNTPLVKVSRVLYDYCYSGRDINRLEEVGWFD